MLWEIEIQARGEDSERRRVANEYDLLTHSRDGSRLVLRAARGYLLEGKLSREQADRIGQELLVDPLVETWFVRAAGPPPPEQCKGPATELPVTVLLKPG